MIKLLLAEDQKVLRESLKIVLEQDPELQVVGCAANGTEALALAEEKAPDIILMDIKMPAVDGIESTRLIKEKFPHIKVVILTTFGNEDNIEKALAYGADGFVLKDIDPEEIITVIKNTVKGLQVFHRNVYNKVRKKFSNSIQKPNVKAADLNLTERELKIIRLIVQGKSNKEIGEALFLSETRIKSIIGNILNKLRVKDRTQLAVYALKNNLIDNIMQ